MKTKLTRENFAVLLTALNHSVYVDTVGCRALVWDAVIDAGDPFDLFPELACQRQITQRALNSTVTRRIE